MNNKKDNVKVTPKAELICASHWDCCEQKGCPAEHRLLGGRAVYNGRCCY
mgnify:CR=1 FL=1